MKDQYASVLRRRFVEYMRIEGPQSKTQTLCLRAMREFPRRRHSSLGAKSPLAFERKAEYLN